MLVNLTDNRKDKIIEQLIYIAMTIQKKEMKISIKRIEFGLKNLEPECERRNIKYEDIKSEYANKSTLTNHKKLHNIQN